MVQTLCIVGMATAVIFGSSTLIFLWLFADEKRKCQRLEKENQQLKTNCAKLEMLATTDPLTGALNRRSGEEKLSTERKRAQRTGSPMAVAIFDIDHFKMVNDNHGHQTGDQVLVEFVQRIQGDLRDHDILCRWGGEEFLLILPECKSGQIAGKTALERIRRKIADQSIAGLNVTTSIGFTTFDPKNDERQITDLIKIADDALYQAKETGRNQVIGL